MSWKRSLGALFVATLAIGAHAQIQKYVVNDLGTTPNSIEITPSDINNDGDVVGTIKYQSAQNSFIWRNGSIRDLGNLPGRPVSYATRINDNGRIVGNSGTGSLIRGYLWENDTMTQVIPTLPANTPTKFGGVNDLGSYAFVEALGALTQQVIIRMFGTQEEVVFVGPPFEPVDVNNQNFVLCKSGAADYGVWEPQDGGGGTFNTTDPTTGDQTLTVPTDMDDFGNVAGYTAEIVVDASLTQHRISTAFFDADATYRGIPLNGDNVTEVYGVNNGGFLVGRSGKYTNLGGRVTYSWRATIGIPVIDLVLGPIIVNFELNRFLPDGSGISLENALAVNESGQVAATYTRNSQVRAVRLTPIITPIAITIPPPPADPTNILYGGESVTAVLTLDGIADLDPIPVNMSTSSAIVRVPNVVTVPRGSDSAEFEIESSPVLAAQPVNIIAERGGYKAIKTIQVLPAVINTFTVTPNPITGGTRGTGTIRLRGQAAGTGLNVALSSSNPAVANTIPTVRVAPNTSQISFNVNTTVVSNPTTVVLTATSNNVSKTTNLVVGLPVLQNLALNPDSVAGGNNSTGTVTLTAPAAGNSVVRLNSSVANVARVPATVTVPNGQRSVNFTVTTIPVTFEVQSNITATFNASTITKLMTVRVAQLFSLEVTGTNPVMGGNSSLVKITLDGPAPAGGATINLSSNDGSAVVLPSSVTIGAGGRTINVAVKTKVIESTRNVQIQAQRLTVTKLANLNVQASDLVQLSFTFVDSDLNGALDDGEPITITARLNRPAQIGGARVLFFSDDPGNLAVPVGIVIPQGQLTGSFVTSAGAAGTYVVTGNRGTNNRTVTIVVQ